MICAASASATKCWLVQIKLPREENRRKTGGRTTSLSAAHGAVGRVLQVAADVADLCVDEALVGKVLAVEVLGAPEAAGRDGAELRVGGDGGGGGGGVGGDGEHGGLRGRAHEAGDEGREREWHLWRRVFGVVVVVFGWARRQC